MIPALKPIKTALISVYDKSGIDDLLTMLASHDVRLLSTGGTQRYILQCGYACDAVEDLTGYPSILGGRVKTLHPKVFGGILARRDNPEDNRQVEQYDLPEIDLVVVDLYPFADTVARGASETEAIEKIDIGGISLIRAAAKNCRDVAIVADKSQYATLTEMMRRHGQAATTIDDRRLLAAGAFAVTSRYDSQIFNYFKAEDSNELRIAIDGKRQLRYGENPHQRGYYYGAIDSLFTQLHGKELSYNNLLDIDAAMSLISDFERPTFAIIKHNNACGLGSAPTLTRAFEKALAGDPVSAFGGVFVANRKIDEPTAQSMNTMFIEVCIAPAYDEEALQILKQKKNRVLLIANDTTHTAQLACRSALCGMLVQERDTHIEQPEQWSAVTEAKVTEAQQSDLLMANSIVKHSKSNAIVLVKDSMLLGSGVGETSRIDALRHAIEKAREHGHDLTGAVMASDAFFPFADCVQMAQQAGVAAVIQPGGSVRDQESIDFCNEHGLAMVMTGVRHFKH